MRPAIVLRRDFCGNEAKEFKLFALKKFISVNNLPPIRDCYNSVSCAESKHTESTSRSCIACRCIVLIEKEVEK